MERYNKLHMNVAIIFHADEGAYIKDFLDHGGREV